MLREREQRSEEISSPSLGPRVNPVNADEVKEVVRAGATRLKARRQENSLEASKQLLLENHNQTESDERKYSDSKSSRKLAASSPELKNIEYTNLFT